MATTLVQRLKQITATNNDDFFNAETLTHYLNKSQEQIIAYCINKETKGKDTVRSLDPIRRVIETTLTAGNNLIGSVYGGIYLSRVTAPFDMRQVSFLNVDNTIPLRQLNEKQLIKLAWGNIRPSSYEAYYNINNRVVTIQLVSFDIYTKTDVSTAGSTVYVYYISNPTDLTDTSETLTGLTSNLENAVLYGAASMMVMQEGVGELKNNLEAFSAMYKQELELNAY